MTIKYSLANRDELQKGLVAYPKTPLQVEMIKAYGYRVGPSSIGADGKLYVNIVTRDDLDNTFGYSEDNGNTIITSEFVFPEFVQFATKTNRKYIVITGSEIYVSDDFNTGFEVVITAQTELDFNRNLGISYYKNGFNEDIDNAEHFLFVGEYGSGAQTDTPRKVYASFNGGVDWETLLTAEVTDHARNSHWHAIEYDPYRGRIWASQGDGLNARLKYSDDLGVTWETIEPLEPFAVMQPTAIGFFPTKVVIAPDGEFAHSLWSIPADHSYKNIGEEKFVVQHEHGIWDKIESFKAYGHGTPVMVDGVMYISHSKGVEGKQTVVASGDMGKTWHNVSVKNYNRGGAVLNALVGPCKDGFLYSYYTANNSRLARFKPIEWVLI